MKYYTMKDMAKELGITKQAVFLDLQAGHLGEASLMGSQTMMWTEKKAKAYIAKKKARRISRFGADVENPKKKKDSEA